jgi:hypothetical protein
MLHNIILIIIIFFIIYIEGSMGIFIVYIGIIGSLFHLNYINSNFSLVIKVIKFSGILKLTHLAMLVNFHMNVVTYQNFNLPHLSHLCWKNSFLEMRIFKLVIWYPNMVQIMSNDMGQYIPSTFIKTKNYLNYFWSIFVYEYIGIIHLFPQIYSNLQPYKMKRNNFFLNILPKLYPNIICKKNCDFFSKVWGEIHSNMHTLESNTMWFPQKASS